MYYKIYDPYNTASDGNLNNIEEGWAIYRTSDEPDGADESLAVVDTEGIADALLTALYNFPTDRSGGCPCDAALALFVDATKEKKCK